MFAARVVRQRPPRHQAPVEIRLQVRPRRVKRIWKALREIQKFRGDADPAIPSVPGDPIIPEIRTGQTG